MSILPILSFFILVVNPMQPTAPAYGPNHDWAPLKAEYSACREASPSYFSYLVCTMSAYDEAVNPTVKI